MYASDKSNLHDCCFIKAKRIKQEPIELKKRLEEVRLLESRRSARLADQERDTNFARLADMGGDRRKTSNSIEVPFSSTPPHNPRKRPPSHPYDCTGDQCNEEEMDECNAALILMNLSNSPKSPKTGEKWMGSSPGSSSASWSSGSSSPPLSDDGHAINASPITDATASARLRTTSVSTSDEGIVVDFNEEAPRKKRANKSKFLCTWKNCQFVESTSAKIERHIRNVHLGTRKKPRRDDHEEEFYYTEIEDDDDEGSASSPTSPPTLSHRDMARPPHEDPEYQKQIVGNFKQGRTLNQQQANNNGRAIYHSSSQYQQQLPQNNNNNTTNCIPTSPSILGHPNYTWPSSTITVTATTQELQQHQQQQQQQQLQHNPTVSTSPLIKHARSSPRPSQSAAPYPSPPYVHHQHQHHQQQQQQHNHHQNSANNSNVLQQLSQQNVTVTAHHSGNNTASVTATAAQQQTHQQHLQQLSSVTITQNYQQQQQQHQHIRVGHHQQTSPTTATASNIVTTTIQQTPQQQQQQQHHHVQPQQQHPPQHIAVQHAVATATKHTPNSPNRRTRGENKKCRKVYGMERRGEWCTQCRWKKACSRFGD